MKIWLIALMLAGLSACARTDDQATDWDSINYIKIACKNNPASSGCKYDEDAADTGRRGGKGR